MGVCEGIGMYYAISDLDSANVIADFPTEAAALAAVRTTAANQGAAAVRFWSLSHTTDDGGTVELARGAALRRRAERAATPA